MTRVRCFRGLGFFAFVLLSSFLLAAQSGDPAAIQQTLNSQFQLTTITADRWDIVRAGSMVEMQREGLMMYGVSSPLPPSNSYKNGKIGQGWGGFGKDLAIGMATPGPGTAEDYPHRRFVAGERCWLTGAVVQKDGILFQLYSEPYYDTRFYASLKIPFPDKKQMPDVDAAMQMVAEVLTVVPSGQLRYQENPRPPAPASAFTSNGDIPPPPPSVPTISVGQTTSEVAAAFGEPTRKAVIGTKEIFFYQDMKVTFINGKVSKVD